MVSDICVFLVPLRRLYQQDVRYVTPLGRSLRDCPCRRLGPVAFGVSGFGIESTENNVFHALEARYDTFCNGRTERRTGPWGEGEVRLRVCDY